MANTVYGPYSPTSWVNGSTAANQTHMNNLEGQASIALHGFNPDLLTAFVLSGLVCTKDGTVVNQLDVTAGHAYLTMTDGTLGLIATVASTASQFTTATPSTTYYLDLNPDGTWSWGTSHSGVTNHLTICSVTTDGSGNISVVTDARVTATTLLSGMLGYLGIPNGLQFGAAVSGSESLLTYDNVNHMVTVWSPQAGATALGHAFVTWNGSAQQVPFSVGGQFGSARSWVDNSGNLTALGGFLSVGTAVSGHYAQFYWAPPLLVLAPPAAGAANGIVLQSWDGSASHNPFSVGGQFGAAPSWVDNSGNYNGPAGGGVPTTRNAAATSVPIYTGTSTPSSPPTGSIWIKA